MKILCFLLLTCILICTSCQEDLTIRDAIDLGEYEGNFMEIKSDVKEVVTPSTVISLEEGIVELSKDDAVVMGLEPGDLISNFDDNGIVFWTRVGEIVDNGASVSIIPGEAGIPDVFSQLRVDTRLAEGGTVILRDPIFNAGVTFVPGIPVIQEVKAFGTFDGGLNFQYNQDASTFVSIQYNESTMNAAEIRLNIADLRLSGNLQYSYTGQVSLGYKKDKILGSIIPLPTPPPLVAVGLGLFMDAQVFGGLKFKGSVNSPNISFDTGEFDVDISLSQSPLFADNSITGFNPTVQVAEEWNLGGSGELILDAGFEFTVRPIAVTSLKAGGAMGVYGRAKLGISKGGEDGQATPIDVDAGLWVKALVSGSMLGADSGLPFLGSFQKFGFFFESQTYRFPLYENTYSDNLSCDKQQEMFASLSPSTLELNVPCPDCMLDDEFRVWINDELLLQDDGVTEMTFDYLGNHVISINNDILHDNSVIIQDINDLHCMQCKRFSISEVFGNSDFCTETFIDPRDDEEYCVTTIGSQTWMAENLRYNEGGVGLLNTTVDPADTDIYGAYYNYEELLAGNEPNSPDIIATFTAFNMDGTFNNVQGICPDGFHIPTYREYETLIEAAGGVTNLKSNSTFFWPSGSLPATSTYNLVSHGWYLASNGFVNTGKKAALWTSNSQKLENFPRSRPYIFTVDGSSDASQTPQVISATGTIRYPCRCILD